MGDGLGALCLPVPVPLAGKASAKARKGGKVAARQSAGADWEEEEYSIRFIEQLRCGGCLRLHACVSHFQQMRAIHSPDHPKCTGLSGC